MSPTRPKRRRPLSLDSRSGLSLLEIILAIAILGGALATIGELIRIGSRSAVMSRELSRAQIFADGIMAEVSSGIIEADSVTAMQITGANESTIEDWVYDINVDVADIEGLLSVTVTVYQDPNVYNRPVTFSIGRLLPDPEFVALLEEEAELLENQFEF